LAFLAVSSFSAVSLASASALAKYNQLIWLSSLS
jgi:hypothetical protein